MDKPYHIHETKNSHACPICGRIIDEDRDFNVNNNHEDGFGWMLVRFDCPHCGTELIAYYNAGNGYDFDRIEKA